MKKYFFTWLFMCVSALPSYAELSESDVLVPFLFPETISWINVDTLPKVEPAVLAKALPRLKEALPLVTGTPDPSGVREACPTPDEHMNFANLLLEMSTSPESFHEVDADEDGIPDILYAGRYPFGEGDMTLLWYGTQNGFELRPGSFRWPQALRMKTGETPLFASLYSSCCGALVKNYTQDTSDEQEKFTAEVSTEQELPAWQSLGPMPGTSATVAFPGLTEIRATPELNDNYLREESRDNNFIQLGNILTIIGMSRPEECQGKVLSYTTDKQWAYVVLEATCLKNRLFSKGEFIRAGWVEAHQITPL